MIARFFLLTFAISWALWVPLIAAPAAPAGMAMVLTGAFGPSLAGLLLAGRANGTAGLHDMGSRLVGISRVPLPWLAFSLLVYPTMVLVVRAIDAALGGTPPALDRQLLGDPGAIAGMALLLLVAGPLSEELGWRGWALDPMQRRFGALGASLLLGAGWAIWHLPLFLIPGTSQAALGFGSAHFWLWMIEVPALAVVYTWVYNHTDRSILAPVLLHFSGNAAYSVFVPPGAEAVPLQIAVIATLAHLALALVAVAMGGASRLGASAGRVRS